MQRLQTLCGGYPFTKHLRLQHRHWRQQNIQCKIHGKLFWSGVCIGIQSGDSLEQPTLHKPAGLNIAQEHSTERNAEAARPPLWQGTSLVQGLCKVHHDFWDSLTETVLYKENLGRYRVTHLLTSAIYLLGTPQCPKFLTPCLAMFQSISSLWHEALEQVKAICITSHQLVRTRVQNEDGVVLREQKHFIAFVMGTDVQTI